MRVTLEEAAKVESVTVDGFDITNICYEADDQLCFAKVYVKGIDGHPIQNHDKDDLLKTTLFGDVQVKFKEFA